MCENHTPNCCPRTLSPCRQSGAFSVQCEQVASTYPVLTSRSRLCPISDRLRASGIVLSARAASRGSFRVGDAAVFYVGDPRWKRQQSDRIGTQSKTRKTSAMRNARIQRVAFRAWITSKRSHENTRVTGCSVASSSICTARPDKSYRVSPSAT